MSERRTALLASAVTLNGGDAAIAAGAARFLARSSIRPIGVTVLDSQPEQAARLHGHDLDFLPALHATTRGPSVNAPFGRVRRRAFKARRAAPVAALRPTSPARRQVVEAIRGAWLVAATGGTYLVDHYPWAERLEEYELAAQAGVPLVFLTQTMGPFTRVDRATRRLGRILHQAIAVLARDEQTLEAITRIAPRANARLAPDLAFALAGQGRTGSEAPSNHLHRCEHGPMIGISVREWHHFRGKDTSTGMSDYLAMMAAIAGGLVSRFDATIEFTSTCQGVPAYRYDDAEVARRVRALLSDPVAARVSVDDRFRRPQELLAHLERFDALVSTRMHLGILGWIAGTPVVGIAYEPKTEALFTRHGLPGLVHDIETLDPEGVLVSVGDILAGADTPAAAHQRAAREASELLLIADTWRGEHLLERSAR